jgi:hypothetical protein
MQLLTIVRLKKLSESKYSPVTLSFWLFFAPLVFVLFFPPLICPLSSFSFTPISRSPFQIYHLNDIAAIRYFPLPLWGKNIGVSREEGMYRFLPDIQTPARLIDCACDESMLLPEMVSPVPPPAAAPPQSCCWLAGAELLLQGVSSAPRTGTLVQASRESTCCMTKFSDIIA